MDEYLDFAKTLAHQAGEMIKEGFEGNLDVKLKSDRSPVTQVDKAINDLVIKSIQQKYPDHGVMGEESDSGTGKEQFQWVCDPLDGTKSFILGVPLTTFIIGLTKNEQFHLGVVYNPFNKRLYHAVKGKGAFCDDKPLKVNDTSLADGGYVILCESSFQFADELKSSGAQIEPMGGAGYRAVLLASGGCSAILQGHADFHDVGPASLIVEEAGGKVTNLAGEPFSLTQPPTNGIILSNEVTHNQLISIANKH